MDPHDELSERAHKEFQQSSEEWLNEYRKRPRFVSRSCGGQRCVLCGDPATNKIGEEIFHDDPNQLRHNLTAYVCAHHFDTVMHAAYRRQLRPQERTW